MILLRRRNYYSIPYIRSYGSWIFLLDSNNNNGHRTAALTPFYAASAAWSFPIILLRQHTTRRRQPPPLHQLLPKQPLQQVPSERMATTKSIRMSSQQSISTSDPSTISQQEPLPKVIIIAGPTGTGKSDVAAILCDRMKGMIVSADSVQVYDKVQIGANKPSRETLQDTPHILLNLVDHTTPYTYNTAEWRRDAIFAIQQLVSENDGRCSNTTTTSHLHYFNEIESLSEQTIAEDQQRQKYIRATIQEAKAMKDALDQAIRHPSPGEGRNNIVDDSQVSKHKNEKTSSYMPVVVGGTMMYVQWLVHGRPDAVRPSDDAVQQAQQVMTQYSSTNDWLGATKYVSDQGTVFQQQVQKLFPSDWYRLRRILEVAITVKACATAIPIEQVYSGIRENGLSEMGYDVRCFFLCPDDRMKHTKIVDVRCEQMIVRGLLEETTKLVIHHEMPDMVSRAIGYRQSIEYLQRENPKWNDLDSFNEYIAKFAAATRQYSQRQMKWFRKEHDFVFVPVPLSEDDPEQRIQQVTNQLIKYIQMSKEEYDTELQSSTSESQVVRCNNAEQAKGMKIYQLQKQILCHSSPELLHAITVADACTRQFQAAKQKRRMDPCTVGEDIDVARDTIDPPPPIT